MSTDPLFMRDGSGEYFWYHNDHLGTPQMMTTSSGAVVWKAKYSSFGKATVDPSSTVVNPLRLAGQYFDSETGLHYNLNRYYDPSLGRYLRADPIGFEGGINPYVYVQNNSINSVDPLGLWCTDWLPTGYFSWWPTGNIGAYFEYQVRTWMLLQMFDHYQYMLGPYDLYAIGHYKEYRRTMKMWRICIDYDECDGLDIDYQSEYFFGDTIKMRPDIERFELRPSFQYFPPGPPLPGPPIPMA